MERLIITVRDELELGSMESDWDYGVQYYAADILVGYVDQMSPCLWDEVARLGRVTEYIKIVKRELFDFKDIQSMYNSFLALRNSELGYEFQDECFHVCKVTEMINIIFNAFQVPCGKSI